MVLPLAQMTLSAETDALTARRLAQHAGELAGLSALDRTHLATAVSEIARNAVQYAGGGTVSCRITDYGESQYVEFRVEDTGPGIERLDDVLEGRYRSHTGMGIGIFGSRKICTRFHIDTKQGAGTTVVFSKQLKGQSKGIDMATARKWAQALAGAESGSRVDSLAGGDLAANRTINVLRQKESDLREQLAEIVRLNRELSQTQQALRNQAIYDPLTGLVNRRALFDVLDKELARAVRSNRPLAVVMADLDHFKALNDTKGHQAGDEALREAAARMQRVMRTYDTLGRYGGEEFLAVIPGCTTAEAPTAAERMRRAIAESPVLIDGQEVGVTASLGVATSDMATDRTRLVELADSALYRAKESGRNRVVLATPSAT